jgi:crossover junction endodeoxyribonuclease RusA
MMDLQFTLPWPPSVNHYWRNFRGRMVIGARGRQFRTEALVAIREQRIPADHLGGPLRVELVANPPDRRRRDLDNLQKALLDAVVAAGVIEDDSHIDDLRVTRGKVLPGGSVTVSIWPLTTETAFTTRRGAEP